MPYRRKAKEAGILNPSEVKLLGRVFDNTAMPGETEHDREARASRILGYYLAGITDENELTALAKQALGR
ncbi:MULTISPECIES: hypothetical protein [Chelativorans]|jgi:hypothetical protein|uniref:Uncharacterized protein n=1 Tax=Chelativorans sp. (strain BNC1) TaxID=266779 RepID=Q11C59_CHESB|nr:MULTISPECIES: hypothetical protein [Chelativorans]